MNNLISMRHMIAIVLALKTGSPLAATIIVDGITCKLANAITAANTDKAVGGCSKGNLADTLKLTAAVYTLKTINNTANGPNGLPSVTTTITVNGNGAVIQRADGALGFRLLHVAPSGKLTLNRTTLRNGLSNSSGNQLGGGILNFGAVTMNNCTVSKNSSVFYGGGIYNTSSGLFVVTNSIVSNNSVGDNGDGGGLFNNGTLSVTNSTVSNNSAGNDGGGLYNLSVGTLTNSSVLNNKAADGGGLFNNGTLSVTNSTVSNNSADHDGGGLFNNKIATLTHVTLSGNHLNNCSNCGGGVFHFGDALSLRNSLIANNPNGGDCIDAGNIIFFQGKNLIEDGGCHVVAKGGLAVDPKLRSLLNNGGATPSYALAANSPAKNSAGLGVCRTTDQRGASRPQGIKCDIGAFEFVSTADSSVQPIITFFDAAVASGELVGAGGDTVTTLNDRRDAVRHQILLAGDLIKQPIPLTAACGQLKATLLRIDTDSLVDGNDYVTGTAGAELAQKIKDLRASLSCG